MVERGSRRERERKREGVSLRCWRIPLQGGYTQAARKVEQMKHRRGCSMQMGATGVKSVGKQGEVAWSTYAIFCLDFCLFDFCILGFHFVF